MQGKAPRPVSIQLSAALRSGRRHALRDGEKNIVFGALFKREKVQPHHLSLIHI